MSEKQNLEVQISSLNAELAESNNASRVLLEQLNEQQRQNDEQRAALAAMKDDQERQLNERCDSQGRRAEAGATQEEGETADEEMAVLVDKLSLAEESIVEFKTNAAGTVHHFSIFLLVLTFSKILTIVFFGRKAIAKVKHLLVKHVLHLCHLLRQNFCVTLNQSTKQS